MQVRDVMSKQVRSVNKYADVLHVAHLMLEHDVGAIPVVEDGKPVGIVTDRDIVCRSLGKGEDPLGHTIADYMTPWVVTIPADAELQDCLELMEANKIRRMLVVDAQGELCGIVVQADIARKSSEHDLAELVAGVSA